VKIEKEAIVTALDSPLLNDNKITGAKTYCCLSFLELMKLIDRVEKSMIIFKLKRAIIIILWVLVKIESLGDSIAASFRVLILNNKRNCKHRTKKIHTLRMSKEVFTI
jgi:hypothetical protein